MINAGTYGIDVGEIAYWVVLDGNEFEPCPIMSEHPIMHITLKSGAQIKLVNKDFIYQVAVELTNRFGGNIRWQ